MGDRDAEETYSGANGEVATKTHAGSADEPRAGRQAQEAVNSPV